MSNRREISRRVILSAAVLSCLPTLSTFAQTSSTFTGASGGTWSVASNWAGSTVPDSGGTATFLRSPNQFSTLIVTEDLANPTLSQIIFNQRNTTAINRPTGSTTQKITLSGSSIISSTGGYGATPFAFAEGGHQVNLELAGTNGMTKNGNGGLLLAAVNSYTGNTTVNGGILRFSADTSLGAAGGNVIMNGGGLQITGAVTSTRSFTLNSNIEIQTFANLQFSSPVGGAGGILKNIGFGSSIIMTAANTFAGPLTIGQGTVSLSTNGTIAPSEIVAGGTLELTNAFGSISNRITNAAPVTLRGGIFDIRANTNSGQNTTDSVGALTLNGGLNQILMDTNAASTIQVTFASLSRQNAGALFVRGLNLGVSGSARGNIFFTAAPTMIGTSTTAGTTNLKIIPFAYGSRLTTGTTASTSASLCTYSATDGIRPLDTSSEFASTISAANTDDNVLLTGDDPVNADKTINSLTIQDTNLTGSSKISITSGAILAPGSTANPPPIDSFWNSRIAPNVDFGANEGVITATSRVDFTGVISGSNGVSVAGGSFVQFNKNNTYTGDTKIANTPLITLGNLPNDGVTASALGKSTTPIIVTPASNGRGGIYFDDDASSTIVVDRAIIARNPKAGTQGRVLLGNGGTTANQNVILNGPITLENGSAITFEGDNAATMTVNGIISGNGVVTDTAFSAGTGTLAQVVAGGASSINVFNNANTYTGGTEIRNGQFLAGNNQAFSTGTIWFSTGFRNDSVNTPIIGALGATGAPRTLSNYIDMRSQDSASATTQTFLGVVFAGDQPLTLDGTIDLGNTNTRLINVTGPTPQNITFAGTINFGGIFKRGLGTLTLNGNGLYGGQLVADGGAVILKNTSAMGINNPIAFTNGNANFAQNGGFFVIDPASGNLNFGNEDVVLTTTTLQQPNGALVNLTGNNSINGALFVSSDDHTVNIATGSKFTSLMRDNSSSISLQASLTKIGGGELSVDRVRFFNATSTGTSALNINDGTVSITGSGTLGQGKLQSLSIAAGKTLDIGNTGMIIDYTGAPNTPFATLKAKIVEGKNVGTGIRSSSIVASGTGKTGIGIAEAADVVNPAGVAGQYQGQVLDSDAVVFAHTYLGDTNLDRKVDSTDFNNSFGNVANYGLTTGGEWVKGDFNYDGKVNTQDFNELAGNFGLAALPGALPNSQTIADFAYPAQATLDATAGEAMALEGSSVLDDRPNRRIHGSGSLGSVVPEPASMSLIVLAAAGLTSRRRRN